MSASVYMYMYTVHVLLIGEVFSHQIFFQKIVDTCTVHVQYMSYTCFCFVVAKRVTCSAELGETNGGTENTTRQY